MADDVYKKARENESISEQALMDRYQPILTNKFRYLERRFRRQSFALSDIDGLTLDLEDGFYSDNAAQFVRASSQSLSIVDNASLSTGDVDFWAACWVRKDINNGYQGIMSHYHGGGGTSSWYLWYSDAHSKFQFQAYGGGNPVVTANTPTPVSINTWYFVLIWHDSVNNTINIRVNNGTVYSNSLVGGTNNGTGNFMLGGLYNDSYYLDGRIDSAVFGKSPPGGVAAIIIR